MLTESIECNKKIDANIINLFEENYKIIIHLDYKKFLLECNGGRLKREAIFNELKTGKEISCIDTFFGFCEDNVNDISYNMECYLGRIPKEMVPVAHDPGDNLVMLSVASSDFGRIYFWNHEAEGDNSFFPILIANSFGDFLSSLKFGEWN